MAFVLAALTLCACGNTAKEETTSSTDEITETTAATQTVKVIDIPLTEEEYAFGVSKDQPELLTKLNSYIAQIKVDGTLDKIMDAYFGDGTKTGVVSAAENDSKTQISIATNAEFPPFESIEGETYYGVDIEIMNGFAQSMGAELVVHNMDFDAVLNNVDAGYSDIAASGLTKNEAREKFVTFSDSYYNAAQLLIVKGDNTEFDSCLTKDDVDAILNSYDASVTIGAQNGTTGLEYIKGNADFGFAGIKATPKGYSNGALAVQDLINGNIQLVIIDEGPAKAIVEKYNAMG